MSNDLEHMKHLLEALEEISKQEVPVAAMVVRNSEIISLAFNQREANKSILAHAEILALEAAAQKLGNWNLDGCTLYVNLEPCAMCAGAILQSHISKVVFGAYDFKAGALGSRYDIRTKNLEVIGGICEEESQKLLISFFASLRTQ
jgi:tRNA(adenine34) deaminase